MKNNVKRLLERNKYTNYLYCDLFKLKIFKRNLSAKKQRVKEANQAINILESMDSDKNHIFFCGVPVHKNMGDQAQRFCIRQWCQNNYPEYEILEIPTWPFYEKEFCDLIKNKVTKEDIIVIQSGYCTTDRHYDHKMHRFIVKTFPNNKILIMPQTVKFFDDREARKTGKIFATHNRLLFLARDKFSYESAKKYFENTKVELYPDIVTSLIGTMEKSINKDGVLLCVRNDSEKKYSNDEIEKLAKKIENAGVRCEISDTNSELPLSELVCKFEQEFDRVLSFFGRHKVVITDRYHGTIFSLIANTPVIVLSTNDHKVKTGTEWFKGVYDDSQYNASSLEEAYSIAMDLINSNKEVVNFPYFKTEYYDKLKNLFENELRQ